MSVMSGVRWRLREFLKEEGISVYQLHKQTGASVSRTCLYRITRSETNGVEFKVLDSILDGLESLTRKKIQVQDVLTRD